VNETTTTLLQVKALVAAVVDADPQGESQSDSELIESTQVAEEVSRLLDVVKTRRAGEIGRRSRRELGNSSLCALHGHVNAPSLVRSITRSGFHEASRRIRVGTLLNEAAALVSLGPTAVVSPAAELLELPVAGTMPVPVALPGAGAPTDVGFSAFLPIADAVATGALGIDAADRVLRVLAPVAEAVDPTALASAASTLANEATARNADEVGSMARGIRDTLNRAGVADREQHLHAQRSLKRGSVVDGLRRVSLVLDPESDVILIGALQAAMSPRLGGPRFRDPADQRAAQTLIEDTRTNEQLALDILVDLVRVGADADPTKMLGAGKPAVRVLMSADDLLSRVVKCSYQSPEIDWAESRDRRADTGVAVLEGHPELVSAATARRYLCNQGALPVVLGGDAQPLDLGRARRLFSSAQRVALSVRDGGCRWPQCERPPLWTESHHIVEFQHGGKTDLKDGVALCRRHHLLLHNNGWAIQRRDHTDPNYWLRPPKTIDPTRTLIAMPAKTCLRT
jgi:hypothetical protein